MSLGCPADQVPYNAFRDMPTNINMGATPLVNSSEAAMTLCCAPSHVQVVDTCTLWCELPDAFMDRVHNSTANSTSGDRASQRIAQTLGACLRETGLDMSELRVTRGQASSWAAAVGLPR
jgi:hypothetical protein